jgi:hypothetical protein
MIEHVLGADAAYARELGLRMAEPAVGDVRAIDAMRAAMLEVLGLPSDGSPIAGRKWTARYAAHRIAVARARPRLGDGGSIGASVTPAIGSAQSRGHELDDGARGDVAGLGE